MTETFDIRDPASFEALLAKLTAPYRGLSPKLDAEMDRDLAAASELGRVMRQALDAIEPSAPAAKVAE